MTHTHRRVTLSYLAAVTGNVPNRQVGGRDIELGRVALTVGREISINSWGNVKYRCPPNSWVTLHLHG